ncbi:MAG: MBL fold metallo-hydrolase [Anaerolineae bacterium]|nr:MBL fold metallo-hydrolase [Anaerolineae bacterium]
MNTYHFSVGNIKLIVVGDGSETLDEAGLIGMVKPLPDAFLQAYREMPQPYQFNYNILYIESAGERILIDTGNGAEGKPQVGNTLDLLQQEGITAGQIDKVILSHLHMDHAGGLTVGNAAVFPNAEIIIPKVEWEHWLESGPAPAERREILKAVFQPYTGRIRFVGDGDSVAEGVTVVALPGHTPGHSGFIIDSEGQGLLHIVDALHLQMQIAFPEVSPVFDLQPDVSAANRRKVLERIADEGLTILAYHLQFPGLGRVERSGSGFAWKPMG